MNKIYYIIIIVIINILSGCSTFQTKVDRPIEENQNQEQVDLQKDVVSELSSVVKSYNSDSEISFFKQKEEPKKERGILRYETKYTHKNKNIRVLLEIVTFNSKVSYTLNITASVNYDYSLSKRFEIKTTDSEEVIKQASNILSSL